MLEPTKGQVHNWKFLQHALSRYVSNRCLFDIFYHVPRTPLPVCLKCMRNCCPQSYTLAKKTHTICLGDVKCRPCGHAQESVPYILTGCTALAQNKYLFRHNMALKVLFYEFFRDQDLLEEVLPWYSPVMPKPVYKSEQVETWWDVPVYSDHQEVRANRVDARIVNHASKKVMTIEMSCPWISNKEKKSEEKNYEVCVAYRSCRRFV